MPHGWEEKVHFDGRTFYIDHIYKNTKWERPTQSTQGWEERLNSDGRTFYINHINKKTRWKTPTESKGFGNQIKNLHYYYF